MFKILLAEDERNLLKIIGENLTDAGYTVTEVCDGKAALEKFTAGHFDIVITDIMMPHMDGNALAKEIRSLNNDIPILMLTALGDLDDKEKGFKSGTDDYLVKPFAMKELLLRIKALLKRYQNVCESRIRLPVTELRFNTNTVTIRDRQIHLAKKEFLLLYKLLSNPNIIFTREQLLNEIWGYDSESEDRTVDTHIKCLREKAESPDYKIITVRGLGYKAVLNEKK